MSAVRLELTNAAGLANIWLEEVRVIHTHMAADDAETLAHCVEADWGRD